MRRVAAAVCLLAALALLVWLLVKGGGGPRGEESADDPSSTPGPPGLATRDTAGGGARDPSMGGDPAGNPTLAPGGGPATPSVAPAQAGGMEAETEAAPGSATPPEPEDEWTKRVAVRKSPFGLGPPAKGPMMGGGGPSMTGHWTKFPPSGLPKGQAVLVATVLDSEGVPVSGAEVYLGPPEVAGTENVSFGDLKRVGATDERGALRVTALPGGQAAVCAKVEGLLSGPRGLDARSGVTVVLRPSRDATATIRLPFALSTLGAVLGRVVEKGTGNPLARAQVEGPWVGATADADGRFRFGRLAAGPRYIRASRTGYAPGDVTVDVAAGKETAVEIALSFAEAGGLELRGVVRGPDGEAVPDATLYVMVTSERGTNRTGRADANGAFVLSGLPDRLRTVGLKLQADAFQRGYMAVVIDFPQGLGDQNDLTLTLPTRFTTLALSITDGGTGEPVTRLLATAKRPESRWRKETTLVRQGSGAVYEGFVEPGVHHVVVDSPEYARYEADLDVQATGPERRFAATVSLVRVRPPVVDVALTVTLLSDANGQPVTKAKVEVSDERTGPISRLDAPRSDGIYRLPALSGDWRLLVSAVGFEPYDEPFRLSDTEPEPALTVRLRPK